jgi:hypothetical protein
VIAKGSTGSDAELVIKLFNKTTGAAITGQSFSTGDIKVWLPSGGSMVSATVANVVEKGLGYYALRLTATESATTGRAYLVLVVGANPWQAHAYEDAIIDVATASQVSGIAVTSAALNATAGSRTITSGSGSGGVANTVALDDVYDAVSDSAGALDFYYEFNISGTADAVGVSAQWFGYLSGILDSLKVYAYNWGGTSWDQIGTVRGIAGSTVGDQEWPLTSAHTSSGVVRIRFANTGLTSATLNTDRILLGYVVPAAGVTMTSAIKSKTDLLPAVAAGSNAGLPIVGTQIPNATAGAVGGLAKITAIGQGPGGVLKPNSMEDNCVYSAGKLTSSRLRVFATSSALASAVPSHADNADGEVERYVSAATYDGGGNLTSFKWTKQL